MMLRYILKRILVIIPALLASMLAIFVLLTYLPGSRLGMLPIYGDGDLLDRFFVYFSIPANTFTRYLRYAWDVFTKLHFPSVFQHRDLTGETLMRAKFTFLLTMLGLIFMIVAGIPLGVAAGHKKGKWQDTLISSFSLVLSSIPPFCLSIFLALLFCLYLHWLPVFGIEEPKNYILPVLTIASGGLAKTIQVVRQNVIAEMKKPYTKTLRAKGVREEKILLRHALRNSLIPTITVLREMSAEIFMSTFIAEYFFAIPGIGYYLVSAIIARDYSVVFACSIVTALFILLFGLLCDVLFFLLEPEVRGKSLNEGGAHE